MIPLSYTQLKMIIDLIYNITNSFTFLPFVKFKIIVREYLLINVEEYLNK